MPIIGVGEATGRVMRRSTGRPDISDMRNVTRASIGRPVGSMSGRGRARSALPSASVVRSAGKLSVRYSASSSWRPNL